ncbi:MAG TPA: TIM barrel protein [Fimbriimonas sp.]|nr:TIM barrel protein [Fimbriimonas sp.]
MNWKLSAFADEIDDDLDIQIAELGSEGIELIDLRSAFGKNVMLLSDEEVKAVLGQATKADLGFNCVASPINKVVMQFAEAEAELAKLHRAIEVAKILGINRIRIFTPEGESFAEVCEWMDPQIDLAVKHNMVLLHENDGRYFGAFPDNARLLMERYASPNFRFAFDFANPLHLGFKAMDNWFPWLLPYLETIHIKDATAEGKICPAGQGVGQVPETLA